MSQIFMVPGTYDENLAHVEPGDVASRNYAEGEFLTWKGVLHSAKTAISTGETFVEDMNVQDESDGGLANALSSKLPKFAFGKTQTSTSDGIATIDYTSAGFSEPPAIVAVPTDSLNWHISCAKPYNVTATGAKIIATGSESGQPTKAPYKGIWVYWIAMGL